MGLSDSLISQFVKVTKDEKETKKETTVYGTIVDDNGVNKVQIDGSDQLTPVSQAATAVAGDRVTVLIKNHKAVVTGNLMSPSVGTKYVDRFEALIADKVSTKEFYAETAKIDTLIADNATIRGRLDASDIKVANLEAKDVEISGKLDANTADINTLKTSKLDAGVAEITYAKIGDLSAATADIRTLMFGSASGNTIQTSFSNSVIAQLGDAQIKSAMIESISADKITAGDIITNDVRVMSEDGKLLISDETIQISDDSRVRVQVGKDAAGDYSINIWDQNGNLMFSEGGITDAAIKEAIIRNDMVSDTANIDAGKLNIDSLFSEINNSSNTIKSSQVYLDSEKQTLDVAFKSLVSEVLDNGAIVSSQGTSIEVLQGYIATKIWQQDIETAVDNIEIGGRNLLLNSSFSEDYSNWYGQQSEITEKYGRKCGHINHTSLNQTKYISQSILNKLEPNTTYKISGWILTENIVQGTTNPKCMFYTDGYYNGEDGSSNWFSLGSNDLPINSGTGEWVKVTGTFKTDGTKFNSATSLNFFIHTRDITGDLYFSELKLEKGNKATDWTPAPEDVEADITTLSTQYSEIEQTVSSISTTVANHTTEISNKADSSTVTTISDKVTTLEQNLDGFQTTVSETYATKESVDAIKIGGRNLILDSGVAKTTSSYSMVHYTPSSPLVAGEKYTISLCVTPAEGVSYYEAYVSGGYTVIAKLYPTGTDKQVLSHTFTAKYSSGRTPDDNISHADIYLYRFPNDGTVTGASTIHWAKVEKGTKATDWTPAPEDVDADISALDTRVTSNESSIIQLSDQITANVTETTYLSEQMSTLTLHFDLFRTSVSETYVTTESANSKFDQYDSDISNLEESLNVGVTGHLDNLYTTTDSLITRMTTVEQTASDLTVSVLDAAKTATNYLNYSGNGLVVGDLTAASLGKNVLIDSDSVDIRNGTTTLASFGASKVILGRNAEDSVIDLCNGAGRISANTAEASTSYPHRNAILIDSQELETESVRFVARTTNEYGASSTPSVKRGTQLFMSRSGSATGESCARLKAVHETTSSGAYTDAGVSAMTHDSADSTRLLLFASDSANATYNNINLYPTKTVMNKPLTINSTEFTGKNKVLWSGGYYMHETHTATLSEAISDQANGIVLVWSGYTDGAAENSNFNMFYIPKQFVTSHVGKGVSMFMAFATLNVAAIKYLYISDTSITGYAANNDAATEKSSGITSTANRFVLRYVIGV